MREWVSGRSIGHFPTRQALLEAVYVDEVEAMAQAAVDLSKLPPWDALSQWLHQYVGFAATKRALNEALLEAAPESDVLLACRTAIAGAGAALVERAQREGVVPPDTNFMDVVRMVGGIAMVPMADHEPEGTDARARTRRAALPTARRLTRSRPAGGRAAPGLGPRRPKPRAVVNDRAKAPVLKCRYGQRGNECRLSPTRSVRSQLSTLCGRPPCIARALASRSRT